MLVPGPCVWVGCMCAPLLAPPQPCVLPTQVYTFELRIGKVVVGDRGDYRCEITSKDKFDSCSFNIDVEGEQAPRLWTSKAPSWGSPPLNWRTPCPLLSTAALSWEPLHHTSTWDPQPLLAILCLGPPTQPIRVQPQHYSLPWKLGISPRPSHRDMSHPLLYSSPETQP